VTAAFGVIDGGARKTYAGGMLKEVTDKPRYTLIDRPFLRRLAEHMTKGARKYGPDNWRLGSSQDELDGFRDSAWRHLMAWLDGETDEDHGAAVVANIMMAEGIKENIRG
jgi:hypothetical protein